MEPVGRTIRLFISSTFLDLEAERNCLHEDVFPAVNAFCRERGWLFEPVDLRWGVSAAAGRAQLTMPICLEEIRRAQRLSPRPNFLIMLGDRYGWRPLPAMIAARHFEVIRQTIPDTTTRDLLTTWYRLDRNARPPGYVLQPCSGSPERWSQDVEWPLHQALVNAIEQLPELDYEEQRRLTGSATEQEIQCGAFAVPDAADHVIAVLRRFRDGPGTAPLGCLAPGDPRRTFYDCTPGGRLDRQAHQRLESLKDAVRQILGPANIIARAATLPPPGQPLTAAPELATAITERLLAIVGGQIERVEAQAASVSPAHRHRQFETATAKEAIGRPAAFDPVRRYLDDRGTAVPLLILGEPGAGKATLLAQAAAHCRQTAAQDTVLARFIGTVPGCSDERALVTDLLNALEPGRRDDPAQSLATVMTELHECLSRPPARGKLVLLLAGLEHLTDTGEFPRLSWLPRQLGPGLRIVLTATEGPVTQALLNRSPRPRVERMAPLAMPAEGRRLLHAWLARCGRQLTGDQEEQVLRAAAGSPIPLFMRLLFEFARDWRSYEAPPPLGGSLTEILAAYLDGLSSSAGHDRRLVRTVLGFLRTAHRGFTEEELTALPGMDDDFWDHFVNQTAHELPAPLAREHRLPAAVWVRLRQDLALVLGEHERHGLPLLVCRHQAVGAALDEVLELGDATAAAMHRRAACFLARQLVPPVPSAADRSSAGKQDQPLLRTQLYSAWASNRHVVDELPWQLSEAGEWERLRDHLVDQPFFDALWELDRPLTVRCWRLLEARDIDTAETAYQDAARGQGGALSLGHLSRIAELLTVLHHPDAAARLYRQVQELYARHGRKASAAAALGNRAVALQQAGDSSAALELYRQAEALFRGLGDPGDLQACLSNQAALHHLLGHTERALDLLLEAESICRENDCQGGLAYVLNNLARIYEDRGEWSPARNYVSEAEQQCRRLGLQEELTKALRTRARIDAAIGGMVPTAPIMDEAVALARGSGGSVQANALMEAALAQRQAGNLAHAVHLLEDALEEARSGADQDVLMRILGNLGSLRFEQGHAREAIPVLEEQRGICERLDSAEGLQACLGNLAAAWQSLGELERADELHRTEEDICRRADRSLDLCICLMNRALLAAEQRRFIAALEMAAEAVRLSDAGAPPQIRERAGEILAQVRSCLSRIALQLEAKCQGDGQTLAAEAQRSLQRGAAGRALELLRRQEELGREADNPRWVAAALSCRGIVMRQLDRLDEARRCHQQAVQAAIDGNDFLYLPNWLGNQAALFQHQGDIEAAIAVFRHCADLWHAYGAAEKELEALHHVFTLMARVRPRDALGVADEALALARDARNEEAVRAIEDARRKLAEGCA